MDDDVLAFFYSSFQAILTTPVTSLSAVGSTEPLPCFSESALTNLCVRARDFFRNQPPVLRVSGPLTIVGDIHGSLHDLLRILLGIPTSCFLFLGDYVDRGDFSLECIVLLFTLTLQFPGRFFLIRGNHECADVCAQYGFRADVVSAYSEALFSAFCEAFSWMPLAAIVNSQIFCVHGGLGPTVTSVRQIDLVERPLLTSTESPFVHTLLWADPNSHIGLYEMSERGCAPSFGICPVQDFLRDCGCALFVRAHQCVDGVEWVPRLALYTVFSASGYKASPPNRSGVLQVGEGAAVKPLVFPVLQRMPRVAASFYTIKHRVLDAPARPRPPILRTTSTGKSIIRSPLPIQRLLIVPTTSRRMSAAYALSFADLGTPREKQGS
jgi:protein phosphatase